MSTIAWDGKMIAADTRVRIGEEVFQGEDLKIQLDESSLIAVCGPSGRQMREAISRWLATQAWTKESGVDPAKIPGAHLKECGWSAYWTHPYQPDLVLWMSSNMPAPLKVSGPHAIGSGREYAMGAMMAEKNAAEAVRIASTLDSGTGGPIDIATFSGSEWTIRRSTW